MLADVSAEHLDRGSASEVTDAVVELLPTLRERAGAVDQQLRLDENVIADLSRAGVFRLGTPRRYGGLEADLCTQQDVYAAAARGCGSTGWVSCLYGFGSWAVGWYDDRAQDEVWAEGPDTLIAGIFSPTGKLSPVAGGYRLSGSWGFNTGCLHASWDLLAAMVETADGSVQIRMALVPMRELEILADWDSMGLRGTGSNTVTATEVFVPEHRTIDLNDALAGSSSSVANAGLPLYNTGYFAHVQAISAAVPVGIAQGAMDLFLDRLPGRGITYTSWHNQAEAPITHHEVADAQLRIEVAELLARNSAERVWADACGVSSLDTSARADVRAQVAYATETARQAVEVLRRNSGASAIQRDVPIQRCFRDIESLSTHAALSLASSREAYGRILVGLDPGTPFL